MENKLSRRSFLKAIVVIGGAVFEAACAPTSADTGTDKSTSGSLFDSGGYKVQSGFNHMSGTCDAVTTVDGKVQASVPIFPPDDLGSNSGIYANLRDAIGSPDNQGPCAPVCTPNVGSDRYENICKRLGF